MRIFLDTTVWLSATLFPGLRSELILRCSDEGFPLLTSALVRTEALVVLAHKFPHRTDAPELFDAIWCAAQCIQDHPEPAADNDARLVTTATEAGAELFITGDTRVQEWRQSGAMSIISPRHYWLMLFPPAVKFVGWGDEGIPTNPRN